MKQTMKQTLVTLLVYVALMACGYYGAKATKASEPVCITYSSLAMRVTANETIIQELSNLQDRIVDAMAKLVEKHKED